MWQFIAEAGLLALDFIYHRWIDPPKPTLPPGQTIQIPRTDSGSPISLIYGRTRVRSPICSYYANPQAYTGTDSVVNDPSLQGFVYALNLLFALGIPFTDGVSNLWSMWVGDAICGVNTSGGPYPIAGNGAEHAADITLPSAAGAGPYCCGPFLEFLDGNASQVFVNSSGVSQCFAGQMMLDSGLTKDQIPSYRGVLTACCFNTSPNSWLIGQSASVPSYSFEVSSYPLASLAPNNGKINAGTDRNNYEADDANPVDVIYDLLTGGYGKLGVSASLIDISSFIAAGTTLYNEGHGYSRAIEGGKTAQEIIKEILAQIDATLYTNPATGLITIKLIRADYDPNTIPEITPDNCEALNNFSLGGWSDAPSKVRIVFSDRSQSYNTNSALFINGSLQFAGTEAGSLGPQEIVIQMPGVTNLALAEQLSAREGAAQSRPLAKCTAIVNRSFYNVCPGDAVSVVWPEANISGMVFRVAAVDRGTLADGKIQIDLIQDYFYQWRDQNPTYPGLPGGGFGGSRTAL